MKRTWNYQETRPMLLLHLQEEGQNSEPTRTYLYCFLNLPCSEIQMHTPTICINTTHVHKCMDTHTCHTYVLTCTTHIYTNLHTTCINTSQCSHACIITCIHDTHIHWCILHMHKHHTYINACIKTCIYAIYKCTYICAYAPQTYTIAHIYMHTWHTHIQIHTYI